MRRCYGWGLAVWLLAACTAAMAQAQTPGAPDQPATPLTEEKPQVTVTAPRAEKALPALKEDEFRTCMGMSGYENIDYTQYVVCEAQLSQEKHVVVDACINKKGDASPQRVIQACSESLDHDIFEGNARFFLFASRAAGYFAQGDKQHALDDYNQALKLAPRNAYVLYNRGVFYAAQSDNDAALRDLDAAIGINPKLVIALRQRARIYHGRGDLSDARADYSAAIDLEPKTATLWSERGYVSLRQKDYESAVKDEEEALRLDPKLARAYFLRGAAAAFGGLGGERNPIDDIKTAVGLDSSLARYVAIKDKAVSLKLPPL